MRNVMIGLLVAGLNLSSTADWSVKHDVGTVPKHVNSSHIRCIYECNRNVVGDGTLQKPPQAKPIPYQGLDWSLTTDPQYNLKHEIKASLEPREDKPKDPKFTAFVRHLMALAGFGIIVGLWLMFSKK